MKLRVCVQCHTLCCTLGVMDVCAVHYYITDEQDLMIEVIINVCIHEMHIFVASFECLTGNLVEDANHLCGRNLLNDFCARIQELCCDLDAVLTWL